jgi:hypothetical protein
MIVNASKKIWLCMFINLLSIIYISTKKCVFFRFDFEKFSSVVQDVKLGISERLRQWSEYESQVTYITIFYYCNIKIFIFGGFQLLISILKFSV